MLRFLIFVAGVMVVGTSMAEGVPKCPVETVPIQIVGEVGSSPVTTLSDFRRRAESVGSSTADFTKYVNGAYPHFNAFVATVTEHVEDRLGKENLCLDNFYSKKRSLLQFMHWSIGTHNPPALVTSLNTWLLFGGCRISSPWIDLTIERKPLPRIRAIVRWNERQFLADQAVLYGAKNVPPGVAKPLTITEYSDFLNEYTVHDNAEISRLFLYHKDREKYERTKSSHESAVKLIEKRIPPDLLWLFRRSSMWDGTLYTPLEKAINEGAEGYTKVILALIDRCLASGKTNLSYENILDVADPVLLEQYKVDMPTFKAKLP